MPSAEETACREDLRRVGLPATRALSRLLAILRSGPETHFALAQVVRIAAKAKLAATPAELSQQLETLADHALLSRLPTTQPETIFDTVPEPHCHLVYEETNQVVDLHVSPETLIALLRRTLSEAPGDVDFLFRFRAPAKTVRSETH